MLFRTEPKEVMYAVCVRLFRPCSWVPQAQSLKVMGLVASNGASER